MPFEYAHRLGPKAWFGVRHVGRRLIISRMHDVVEKESTQQKMVTIQATQTQGDIHCDAIPLVLRQQGGFLHG